MGKCVVFIIQEKIKYSKPMPTRDSYAMWGRLPEKKQGV